MQQTYLHRYMSYSLGILFCSILITASIGAVPLSLTDLLQFNLSEQEQAIFYSIRLPRILLALLVGGALAISGAAMQGLFRNPLADPGLIGVSSGAALMVGIMIVLGGSFSHLFGLYALGFAAFVGALGACLCVFHLAKITGTWSVTYMLLAGIAINALAGGGTGLLMYVSNDQQLRALTFWSMGSVGGAMWPAVTVALTVIMPISYYITRQAHGLNLLMIGEKEAHYLGVEIKKIKKRIILSTALLIGISVALTGIIGFVGLVVPHLIRLGISTDNRLLLPLSACGGALLLLIADTLARTLVSPAELPVGIITSLVGGPFFLWLLMRQFKVGNIS